MYVNKFGSILRVLQSRIACVKGLERKLAWTGLDQYYRSATQHNNDSNQYVQY